MANRAPVEKEKPARLSGFIRHSEAFGLPAERGVTAAEQHPGAGEACAALPASLASN